MVTGATARRVFTVCFGCLVAVLGIPDSVVAHVEYVTPGGDATDAVAFLIHVLGDPLNLAIVAASGVGIAVAAVGYLRARPLGADVAAFRQTMRGYRDLLPWLVRLSVGLPLVGAGFAGYFFSPVVHLGAPVAVRLFGVGAGFLLLFGFATRLVAAGTLFAYLVGLAFHPELLLAFEFVPGLLAAILLGGNRPSADHVFGRLATDDRTLYARLDPVSRFALPLAHRLDAARAYVPLVLRVGLGVSFLYLGVTQKLANPADALAVVQKYDLTAVVPVSPGMWVVGAGLSEILVGTLLLVGLFVRAASVAAIGLFVTTLFGLPDDPVLAHVSLFGLVSALLITGAGTPSLDARLATDPDIPASGVARDD